MHIEIIKAYGGLVLERALVWFGGIWEIRYMPGAQWALSQCPLVIYLLSLCSGRWGSPLSCFQSSTSWRVMA